MIHLNNMRNSSKIRSKRQAHSLGYEDPRIQEQRKILQQSVYGNRFLIREVPIQQGLFNEEQQFHNNINNNNNNKNKVVMMKDYDVPELVVFIQEDPQQFVKDIRVDRVVTPEKEEEEEYYCDLVHTQYHYFNDDDDGDVCHNNMKRRSSSDSNLVRIMKRTSQTLEEAFRNDEEFSSRSSKNWKFNNRVMEYPNQCSCPYCAQFTNTITIPTTRRHDHDEILENNSQSTIITTGSSQIDDFPQQVSSTTNSGSEAAISSSISAPHHHHQKNDSISSAHSFAFPILPVEWSGSPVRMAEAEKTKSRNCQWWWTCLFPCFRY